MTDSLRGDTICSGINGKGCGEVVQVIIYCSLVVKPALVTQHYEQDHNVVQGAEKRNFEGEEVLLWKTKPFSHGHFIKEIHRTRNTLGRPLTSLCQMQKIWKRIWTFNSSAVAQGAAGETSLMWTLFIILSATLHVYILLGNKAHGKDFIRLTRIWKWILGDVRVFMYNIGLLLYCI